MTKRFKGVFFDLDGTLVDTSTDLRYALNRLMHDQGLEEVSHAAFLPYTGQGVRVILNQLLGITPKDPHFKEINSRFLEYYVEARHQWSEFFPGIPGLLQRLQSDATPWGIVTGKWREFTLPLLDHLGLSCQCLVCGDDTTPKPSPEPLKLALSHFDDLNPADCLYIGDELRDYQAASACGMLFIGVSWGYQADALLEQNAKTIVHSVEELMGHLYVNI